MESSGKMMVEKKGRIMLLTISNPGMRNALGPCIYRTGVEALRRAAEDSDVGAVILTGENSQFCSGGNLNRLRENRTKSAAHVKEGISNLHGLVLAMRYCPKPVIAAVEGTAAGAGFSLALACDLIVAAEDARFVMAYVKAGLSPDGGATVSLARALPPQALAEIFLEGGELGAARLSQMGIVNRLCKRGEAYDQAMAWGAKLAAGPMNAMAKIKRLISAAYENDMPAQLDLESKIFVESLFHEECGEGIDAFFEKRSPIFPKGVAS
jgi:enoyl-CoA hydratase/carnithine racemase